MRSVPSGRTSRPSPVPHPGTGDPAPSNGESSSGPATGDRPAPSREGAALGAWGHDAAGQPRLDLTDDGRFAGTDGCNRLFGTWTEEAGTVRFCEVGSTRMACPDVDTWLARLHSGYIDGEVLRISDADGAEIGALGRVP